jgi:hypothetical protein
MATKHRPGRYLLAALLLTIEAPILFVLAAGALVTRALLVLGQGARLASSRARAMAVHLLSLAQP